MRAPAAVLALGAVALLLALPAPGADALPAGQSAGQRGPAFCRTGAGHPVHGRLWCIEKGFGLGGSSWKRASGLDLRLHAYPEQAIDGRRLPPARLDQILGREALGQLFWEADRELQRGTLGGYWRGGREQGVVVLEIVDGSEPIAELTDRGVDGTVDVVLVIEPKGTTGLSS